MDQLAGFGPDIQVEVLSEVPSDGGCMMTGRSLKTRTLVLTAVEWEAAFVLSLATGLVAGILSIQSHHVDNCCLLRTLVVISEARFCTPWVSL